MNARNEKHATRWTAEMTGVGAGRTETKASAAQSGMDEWRDNQN